MPPKAKNLEDRFWGKVMPAGECLVWTASTAHYGYGQIRIGTRTIRAHRLSWEIHYGPIPPGMSVLHQCDTPACVAPTHLKLGTQQDNMRDMSVRERTKGVPSPKKLWTHCGKGHEYTPENTKLWKNGSRGCRICVLAGQRRRYAKRRAEGTWGVRIGRNPNWEVPCKSTESGT